MTPYLIWKFISHHLNCRLPYWCFLYHLSTQWHYKVMETCLLFCSQHNLWMLLLQMMVEEPSESKKFTISFLHFYIKHFPIPSATLSAAAAFLAATQFRILKKPSHAHVWMTYSGFVGMILNIILLTVIEPHGLIPVSLPAYSLLGVFLLLC